MSDPAAPPGLQPVPGSARGRGRILVDLSDVVDRGTRRRAGVFRRALRREVSRLRDPRRIAAIVLLSLTFAVVLSGLIARGEAGGADARAYWAGVRIWLNGGDPYHPIGPVPAVRLRPWMLPLFAPWAVLPWDVAWFVWRVGTILLLLWTIHWAYRRRPLTTAVIVAVLAFPFGANLDTGNINLQLTLMLWAAQFTGPRLGGLLWALATWMKWVPVVLWPMLPGRAKAWGIVWLLVSVGLSLLTLPLTIVQLQALFGFGRARSGSISSSTCGRPCPGSTGGSDPFDFLWPATGALGVAAPGLRFRARLTSASVCRPATTAAARRRPRRRSSTGRSRTAPMPRSTTPATVPRGAPSHRRSDRRRRPSACHRSRRPGRRPTPSPHSRAPYIGRTRPSG